MMRSPSVRGDSPLTDGDLIMRSPSVRGCLTDGGREGRGGVLSINTPPTPSFTRPSCPEVLLESGSVSLVLRPDFSEFCPIRGCLCKPRSSSSSLFSVLVLRTRSIDLVLPDFSVLRTLDGDMFSLYFHFNRESGRHFKGRNFPAEFWGRIPLISNPLFHLSQMLLLRAQKQLTGTHPNRSSLLIKGNACIASLLFQPKRNTSEHRSKDLKPLDQAQDRQ
ncbi:hypothetical protein Taro_020981 [Colocasia esculenta]|uniref:Uncharacterized protein n=1 Tax=Colocasia esculenta TaxID=4460 RepID=A0A843V408_COLES|nr:hypothetical protein [Colocasia esculenta]